MVKFTNYFILELCKKYNSRVTAWLLIFADMLIFEGSVYSLERPPSSCYSNFGTWAGCSCYFAGYRMSFEHLQIAKANQVWVTNF